jgi:predicted nucleic acid-binding protein
MADAKRQAVHLFIDTNIFLSFFAYSKDDLDQLEKLVELLRIRRIKLYLTQQVVDEFYRNRETKLAESLAAFSQCKVAPCPNFMLPLEEYAEFRKHAKRFEKAYGVLVDRAKSLAEGKKLMADAIFAKLREMAGVIPRDSKSYKAALRRFNLGNPPGKSKTMGDELNWELLMKSVPDGNDLHLLTKDGDYTSKLTATLPKGFLEEEWREKKSGGIHIYEQLRQFFAENFPEDDFSLDIEKREAIDHLSSSGSFASTHSAVALLSPYVGFFTDEEVEEIVQAAVTNSQVSWIMTDPDVNAFFNRMLEEYRKEMPQKLKSKLKDLLATD